MSDEPAATATVRGPPIQDQVRLIFSHWGTVSGVILDSKGLIQVQFEDGITINFGPISAN